MNEYYKGKIIFKKNINFKKIKFNIDEYDIITVVKPNYTLSGAESRVLYNYFKSFKNNKKFAIDDDDSKMIIDRITYKFFKAILTEMDIIYKKIIIDGDQIFGKEINTGFIFPLLSLNDTDLKYEVKLDDKYGSISTHLKHRDCFHECKVYLTDERKANNNDIKKYLKNKKLKQREKKLKKLYSLNILKYDIEKKEIININNNQIKKYTPYYGNTDLGEFINLIDKPKVLQKTYKAQ